MEPEAGVCASTTFLMGSTGMEGSRGSSEHNPNHTIQRIQRNGCRGVTPIAAHPTGGRLVRVARGGNAHGRKGPRKAGFLDRNPRFW